MTSLPITLQSLKAYPALTCKRSAQSEKFSLCRRSGTGRAGRFILPANLKDFCQIDKNIVINGAGSKVEIWSEEKWDSYSAIENFDQELAEIGTKYGV